MLKGKKSLAIVCGAVAPLFVSTSAFAGLTVNSFAGGIGDNWPTAANGAAPTSAVGSNPVFDTGDGGSSGAPDGVVTNNSVVPGEVVGETFNTGATGFNLGEIAVFGSGSPNTPVSLHLFQMISSVTGSTTGYILSTAEVGHDLFGAGAGLNFTFNGGTGAVEEFVFNNSGTTDEIALAANTEYSFELWDTDPIGATSGFFVGRNVGQPYSNGQEFNVGGSPVVGAQADNSTVTRGGVSGSPRNMSFALYAAPPAPTWVGNPGDGLWTTAANWVGGIPNSAGISATFSTAITAPTTVNLNGNETVGDMIFSTGASYTIANGGVNGGTLTLDNAGQAALIEDRFGSHSITAPIALTSFGVTVAVGQSTDTMTLSGGISGTGGVTLGGTTNTQGIGTVVLSGTNTYQGATAVNTGTLVLNSANTLPSTTSLTIGTATTSALVQLAANTGGQMISGLTINANSSLDIFNNHVTVSYANGTQATADANIRQLLTNGYNGGTWTGTGGIISIDAQGTANSHFAIGYADGADKIVHGLSSGQILVQYTLYGDADLDLSVTGNDFTILAGNLGKVVNAWDKGDFDYDGSVTGNDFTKLVGNLGKTASGADISLPASDYAAVDAFAAANGLEAVLPEPASAGLLLVAGVGMLARRRRSRSA